MDTIHVVLSSELFSAKVFTIKDIVLAVGAAILAVVLVTSLKLGKKRRLSSSRSISGFVQRRKVKPRKQIAEIAESLDQVVNDLIHSQYVMKDKTRYASVFQTPLKDALLSLKSLSDELQKSANYSEPLYKSNSLAYADSNGSKASPGFVCTQQILHDILPAIKDYAETERISLRTIELAHGCLDVATGLTEKMLRELLLNAVKHNLKNTEVVFKCSFITSYAVFEVHDNGKGMSAKDVNHALTSETLIGSLRSRRLSDLETQVNLRTIAMEARELGGRLEIDSALNYGTTIRLILPANVISPRPKYLQFRQTTCKDVPLRSSRKKLLVVSQHNFLENIITENFSQKYEIYYFPSFDKGLAALFDVKPDLVVADFSWQYALGIQFCQFLRGSTRFSNIPFIMVTMATNHATRVNIYASGVSAIVEKPLDPQELSTIINNLSRNHLTHNDELREACPVYDINSGSARKETHRSDFTHTLNELVQTHFREESFNRFNAASALHMSEKTLQRRMTEHFGMPFGQYLRKHRLDKARALLLEGHLITEVTFEVGFNSSSYFGQCFKQEFGYPPSMLSKAYG